MNEWNRHFNLYVEKVISAATCFCDYLRTCVMNNWRMERKFFMFFLFTQISSILSRSLLLSQIFFYKIMCRSVCVWEREWEESFPFLSQIVLFLRFSTLSLSLYYRFTLSHKTFNIKSFVVDEWMTFTFHPLSSSVLEGINFII